MEPRRHRDEIRRLVEVWLHFFGIDVDQYDDPDKLARDVEALDGPFSVVTDDDDSKISKRMMLLINVKKDEKFASIFQARKMAHQRKRVSEASLGCCS